MGWLDLFDSDETQGQQARFCAEVREDRHGACEDDVEVTAPYIGVCPEESYKEKGSPLHFASPFEMREDQDANAAFEMALKVGW